jgi:radical SAM superfamily enzyme YgiQ (UPF0313 family)
MANIALVSCNLTREPYPVYPLGMSLIAAAARSKGHTVLQHDLLISGDSADRLFDDVRSFRPDVIGLSLRNIDNVDSSDLVEWTASYVELARAARQCGSGPVVLGGSGYSLFPQRLLDLLEADYGIVGEGETAFCRLVERLLAGEPPERRILYGRNELTGASLVAAARDPRLVSFYASQGSPLNLQTKRGCPHRCAYCTYPMLEGRSYRFRAPAAVVDEIELLVHEHGADYYAITDSVLNDREDHYLLVAQELIRRRIRVPWMAFFRPSRFRPEEVDVLRRAGLHAAEWGTDCSTEATLEQMCKDFTWSDVERSNRLFAEAGICNAHFIIFGGPGETEQTLRKGLDNIERLSDCVVFAYCGVRILPETDIHRRSVAEGVVAAGEDLLEAKFYVSPGLTQARLDEVLRDSFGARRDRVYPPGQDVEKVQALHALGHRGPGWNYLLGSGWRGGRRARPAAREQGGSV